MRKTIRLAHLSDVHLAPLPPLTLPHWNLKRALGFINWQRKRRFLHLRSVIDRMVADLRTQSADHIAVSGDLTNIGLPAEHMNALAWLEALGTPNEVSVVPGNHDIYCRLWRDPGVERWRAYMRSNAYPAASSKFPYVRILDWVALIGLNSAVPTPPGVASGEIDSGQLQRLDALLCELGTQVACRVVMLHHPPLPGQARPRRALRNAEALKAILERRGAELVIHGHNHRNMQATVASGCRAVPIVGVPSFSSARNYRDEPAASYNIYDICGSGSALSIGLTRRGITEFSDEIQVLDRCELTGIDAVTDN
ncbi:MAG: metallophosphoesterase family protein [Hyphomicrobiaceae bacterium]